METLVKQCYFKIIGREQSCFIGIIAVECLLDGSNVFLVKFGWDVESRVEVLVAHG
jgi:hypothetical protein